MTRPRTGNSLRRSEAAEHVHVINNFPGRYPTEDWQALYWDVRQDGTLEQREAVLQLPRRWGSICAKVTVGYPGCIQNVRRWGVALYPSILEDIGFDPASLLPQGSESSGAELLRVMLAVTHFDLPGYFIIASREHPFLLYDPDGTIKGSFIRWRTYLGALAFLLSEGEVNASFLQLADEAEETYSMAVGYLLNALHAGRATEQ